MDPLQRTSLMYAIIDRRQDEWARLIRVAPEDINKQEAGGWTALHFAAQNLDDIAIEALLMAGAEVDAQDNHGNTPFSTAVFNAKSPCRAVQLLLDAGADPDKPNHYDVTPRSLAYSIANSTVNEMFE